MAASRVIWFPNCVKLLKKNAAKSARRCLLASRQRTHSLVAKAEIFKAALNWLKTHHIRQT